MKKVDFQFRYEHKVREIESLILIRLELERRGYSVDFIGNYEYDKEEDVCPTVFVAPAVYNNNQLKGEWRKYGAIKKIANLQWEQLFHIEEENKINAFHNITGVGQRIVNFCWGESTKERIVRGGADEKKAIVVGQINTDLLRGDFRKDLLTKKELAEKYSLDVNKRWLLFMSSFAHCEMEEFQAKMSREARGNENFDMMVKIAYKSRDIILDWFEDVVKKHSNVLVIYRPHPDETGKYERFQQLQVQYNNFQVISNDALKHWINACDKIYNWYSTGIVDAIVLGEKPYRMLRPVELPMSTDYKLMYDAQKIETKEQFDQDLMNDSLLDVISKDVFDSYYYIPQSYVYKKICDILEEIICTKKYDVHYTFKEKISVYPLYLMGNVKRYIKKFVPPILIDRFKNISCQKSRYMKMLADGYNKNVMTNEEYKEISERLKPIVYGCQV